MKICSSVFWAFILSISGRLFAQDSLSINPHALDSLGGNTFVLSDSALAGNAPSFGIWVYNRGDSIFTDSLSFDYTIDSANGFFSLYNTGAFNGSGISFPTQRVTINPHDSLLLYSVKFQFYPPVFDIGSSTVVIWPHPLQVNAIAIDSAYAQITITSPNAIRNTGKEDLKVYVSHQELFIDEGLKNTVKDIRIFDATGRLLPVPNKSLAIIPISQYAYGIYFVELLMQNNERHLYKVFNLP
jgi:hypothetical protein